MPHFAQDHEDRRRRRRERSKREIDFERPRRRRRPWDDPEDAESWLDPEDAESWLDLDDEEEDWMPEDEGHRDDDRDELRGARGRRGAYSGPSSESPLWTPGTSSLSIS